MTAAAKNRGPVPTIESRLVRIEADVHNVAGLLKETRDDMRQLRAETRLDFHWIIGLLITGFIGIAGLVISAAVWIR